MNNYDELLKSIEPSDNRYMPYDQVAGAIEELQSVIGEKQKLLNASIADLADGRDCKYCAYIDQCSMHQIERNLTYKGCGRWQWRGAKTADKPAEMPLRKQ